MAVVDELIAVLGFDLEGEANARKFQSTLDRVDGKMRKFAGGVAKYGTIAVTAMGAATAALGKSIISTTSEFEGFETTLLTIEGSAEKARESLDWIADFTRTTPYELAGVADAFVKLKAYGIDPVANDTLRILGDTASAMNKPLNQAVEAFADAATGEFERLKEFGIRARQTSEEVTFSWTKNGEQLTKVVKNNGNDIRKFLLETMGERFNGAMIRQSKTWAGMMSNLGDAWTMFLRDVGEGGFFESTKDRLASLLETLNELDENGTLDRWAEKLSSTFTAIAGNVGWFVERMAGHVGFLRENFDRLKLPLGIIGVGMAALLAYAFPVAAGLAAVAFAVDQMLIYMQDGGGTIGHFVKSLQDLLGTSQGISEAIFVANPFVGIVASLVALEDEINAALTEMDFFQAGQKWVESIQAGLESKLEAIKNLPKEIEARLLSTDFFQVGRTIMDAVFRGMQSVGESITSWFSGLIPDWAGKWFGGGKANAELGSSSGLSHSEMMANFQANSAKTDSAVAAAEVNNVTDNRNQAMTNQVTVNQTVTQEVQAPGAVARAVGNAAAGAAAQQRTQIEAEPAIP